LISPEAKHVIPKDENVIDCKSIRNKLCAAQSGRVRIHLTV
jgi:hypothetical protein